VTNPKKRGDADATLATVSLLRQVSFAILLVAAGLLLIEGAARVWLALASQPRAARSPGSEAIETAWFEILEQDLETGPRAPGLYRSDAELFWRLQPDTSLEVENRVYRMRTRPVTWRIEINADGQRGAPFPSAESASPLIAALGDSCTFGFRVGEQETYPALLQASLRERGMPRATVLNYGVPGYTSFQGRRLLDRLLARGRPDYVILAFGANDLERDVASDAAKAERLSPLRLQLYTALNHLAIARLLGRREGDQRRDPDRPAQTTRVSPAEFRENLLAMVRAARNAGARVILLDLVLIGPVFRETIAEISRQESVPWLDGREVLRAGLSDLLAGRRHQRERAEIDRFWDEDVEQYRFVYYDESFYRKLARDPIQSGLLRYLMIEPVHASPLGNRLIAEAVGARILEERVP
jgi:lysophospholipase L1-like esterase